MTVTAVPLPTYFYEGEFRPHQHGQVRGLYVVIADSGTDRVNVAKLGGDGGRYVRTTSVLSPRSTLRTSGRRSEAGEPPVHLGRGSLRAAYRSTRTLTTSTFVVVMRQV